MASHTKGAGTDMFGLLLSRHISTESGHRTGPLGLSPAAVHTRRLLPSRRRHSATLVHRLGFGDSYGRRSQSYRRSVSVRFKSAASSACCFVPVLAKTC